MIYRIKTNRLFLETYEYGRHISDLASPGPRNRERVHVKYGFTGKNRVSVGAVFGFTGEKHVSEEP